LAVKFNYQIENFRIKNSARIKDWLEKVIKREGFNLGDLIFIFTDDNFIIEINREFLENDYSTDVIAFNYSDGKNINAEIYVGLETVYRNARILGEKRRDELYRVMVHGLLHILGYDDKKREDRIRMRERENEYMEKIVDNEF